MRYVLLFLIATVIFASCAEAPKKQKLDAYQLSYKKWCQSNVNVTKGLKVIRTLNAVKMVAPKYPKKALKKKLSGCVHMVFDVDGWGRVRNLRVLKATPVGHGFEKSAAKAVTAWIYNQDPKKNVYLRMDYSL
ncbi:MAG: TonB family protein [Bdellovibrionales bacterium]|nr:TonB family protein [Bdellovibrionales bacterium]NQZ17753.1 TonB family protein [Bdellovibrionales bacterium]